MHCWNRRSPGIHSTISFAVCLNFSLSPLTSYHRDLSPLTRVKRKANEMPAVHVRYVSPFFSINNLIKQAQD